MKIQAPFLLVGIDFEGESRECGYFSLSRAVADGVQSMQGIPPWQGWAVYGPDPWHALVTNAGFKNRRQHDTQTTH